MPFGCGLVGRDIRRGPREGVPCRVRDAKGGAQRRRRHRDHTSEAATIDAGFGRTRVVSVGRRRGVACVANDIEGIDDGVEDTQAWWADIAARDPDELEEDEQPATADVGGLWPLSRLLPPGHEPGGWGAGSPHLAACRT
jgi:hypothetical protein